MSTSNLPDSANLLPNSGKKSELLAAWHAGWKPPPRISVAEWADRYRYIAPEEGGGKWETQKYEIARGAMLAVTEPGVHTITTMVCTQLLKTSLIINTFGYFAHLDPCPMLLVQPKDEAAESFSKERIGPTIRVTPVLKKLIGTEKTRDSAETIKFKSFLGGFLAMVGAGSPTNLASRPIRVTLFDEIDKYESSREGDPIVIGEERTSRFGANWLSIRACSPTVEDESRVAKSYATSDQRRASLVCPHCGHRMFPDFFKHVQWDKLKDANGNVIKHLPKTAKLYCEGCGAEWSEGARLEALKTARWHQTRTFDCCGERQSPLDEYHKAWTDGDENAVDSVWNWWEDKVDGRYAVYRAKCKKCGAWGVDNTHAGFQASKLYSPSNKDRPQDVAAKWLEAKGNDDLEQAWWNTQMGLPHRPAASRNIAVDTLLARREVFEGKVPNGVAVITVGIDTQAYRLEIEVVGWGKDEESWSIDYHVIDGQMNDPNVQAQLDAYLKRVWVRADGKPLAVMAACHDSGGNYAQDVYAFSKARLGRNIWAIKGASERDGARNPVWPTKKVSKRNKAAFRPIMIGGNTARDQVRNRLFIEPPQVAGTAKPGYCHFPADRDVGYFEQLLADKLVIEDRGKLKVRIWNTPAGKANEASDCRVYAYAALCGLNQKGLQLNRRVEHLSKPPDPGEIPPQPESKPAEVKPETPSDRMKRLVSRLA